MPSSRSKLVLVDSPLSYPAKLSAAVFLRHSPLFLLEPTSSEFLMFLFAMDSMAGLESYSLALIL